ncbi:MAG: BlaI/MecI/CopY family transcriptional regulator [Hyphomicrobiales bacterium]
MKELTKAEEQVMQYVWKLKKCFLKDIVNEYPDPKPAYTTVSTVVRVLIKKGFLGFKAYGKTNEYYAKLSKSSYTRNRVTGLLSNYFNGSVTSFVSYFTKDKKLSTEELQEMRNIIDKKIKELEDD